MSEPNPYGAPQARVEDRQQPVNRRFNWKAILVGAGADLGGTIGASIVLVVVFAALTGSGEATSDGLMTRLQQSWPFLMLSMIVGSAFTVLGGYVAGRIAGHSFYKHALGAGAISFVIGILLSGPDDGPYSGLLSFLGYTLHFPLAALGGWLALRRASESVARTSA